MRTNDQDEYELTENWVRVDQIESEMTKVRIDLSNELTSFHLRFYCLHIGWTGSE